MYSHLDFHHKRGFPNKRVKLSKPSLKALRTLLHTPFTECTNTLLPPSNYTHLTTDASEYAWGAVLRHEGNNLVASGNFPPSIADSHIGVKELYGIFAGLTHFLSYIRSSHLLLYTDNQPAMYMLRKFSTQSPTAYPLVRDIFHLLRSNYIFVDPEYIPSKSNIADPPSRRVLPHTYTLPTWFVHLLRSRYKIGLHVFAPRVQPFCPHFMCLDDSLEGAGNPWLLPWKSPHWVFLFPPLIDKFQLQTFAKIVATPN